MMLDCICVENMRKSDAYTIANFVPSLTLMHRAACGVYHAAQWHGKTAIIAGSGNNGGDGFALACILKENGYECSVFTVSSKLSDDSAHYAQKAKTVGVNVQPFEAGCLRDCDIAVDCLLGTGFHGQVRENYRQAIEEINASGVYVISVDINSGLNGDTGEGEVAVRSDLTVTIGYVKRGLVTDHAGKFMKRLVCADIGILLAYEEEKLCNEEAWLAICEENSLNPNCKKHEIQGVVYHRSPSWLDMRIQPYTV